MDPMPGGYRARSERARAHQGPPHCCSSPMEAQGSFWGCLGELGPRAGHLGSPQGKISQLPWTGRGPWGLQGPALTRGRQRTGRQRGRSWERSIREQNAGQILPGEKGEGAEGTGEHQSCPRPRAVPRGTAGSGPALTCAAARTFWFKLLPWRGSGGPVNAARHEARFWGDVQLPERGRNSALGTAQPPEQPQGQEQRWALCRAGLSLPAPRRAACCPRRPAPRPVTCGLADEDGVPLQLQDELGGALGACVQQDLQHLPAGLGVRRPHRSHPGGLGLPHRAPHSPIEPPRTP